MTEAVPGEGNPLKRNRAYPCSEIVMKHRSGNCQLPKILERPAARAAQECCLFGSCSRLMTVPYATTLLYPEGRSKAHLYQFHGPKPFRLVDFQFISVID